VACVKKEKKEKKLKPVADLEAFHLISLGPLILFVMDPSLCYATRISMSFIYSYSTSRFRFVGVDIYDTIFARRMTCAHCNLT